MSDKRDDLPQDAETQPDTSAVEQEPVEENDGDGAAQDEDTEDQDTADRGDILTLKARKQREKRAGKPKLIRNLLILGLATDRKSTRLNSSHT